MTHFHPPEPVQMEAACSFIMMEQTKQNSTRCKNLSMFCHTATHILNWTWGLFMYIFWVKDHEVIMTKSGAHGDCSKFGIYFWPKPIYQKCCVDAKMTCLAPKFSSFLHRHCYKHSQMCRQIKIQLLRDVCSLQGQLALTARP